MEEGVDGRQDHARGHQFAGTVDPGVRAVLRAVVDLDARGRLVGHEREGMSTGEEDDVVRAER